MAKNQSKVLNAATLADDKSAIDACKKITTYAPAKADYNQAALDASQTSLEATETAYNQADAALKTARDNMVAAQWARHNLVLGMRTQVRAQFGDDSNEVQAVGLKKKSEYKNKSSAKTTPKPTP